MESAGRFGILALKCLIFRHFGMWSAGRFGILALKCLIIGILACGVPDVSAFWH
jgi:hypothetical protein